MREELLRPFRDAMAATAQDPLYHGEGDVLRHTHLVCDALQQLPDYQTLDADHQTVLYLAALFHDVGKIRTTRQEAGRLISPGHSRVGAEMTRHTLWTEAGLCGTARGQAIREGVCGLIRHHSLPLHAIDDPDGKLRLLRFAADGALSGYLTVRNLCLLARADVLGRVCDDQPELLDKIDLCQVMAEESGCLDGPYPFADAHTRFACLSGRSVAADYPLYDDAWGQVILLSGLPGTGKDTWIAQNCPDLPMVSLDAIRARLGISPTDNQSAVIDAAREEAKIHLRSHRSFVWNATNVSPMIRQKQLELFHAYGAATRIVYLETPWEELLRRNRDRAAVVPESAIAHMLEILSPPRISEARRVEWHIV